MAFNYNLDFENINFREQPELYQIGKGEQGVFLVEPYKSEILPHWRFKNAEIAQESSTKIYEMFLNYLEENDLVGADMARKFLQMGFTRARRYANHKSGQKYAKTEKTDTSKLEYPYSSGSQYKGNPVLEQSEDWATNEKAKAAAIFKEKWFLAKDNPQYKKLAQEHRQKYKKSRS
ncbi:MAG: DUF4385 domain-containing protein [Jaaginema sp. PMC 1079.18]|nr:DUF4385 domain-containing protein [Jaaginema sp. PMC 1080.18]MEC4851694.1 DUF4385 domain-containing protein [Jaaginema sp. PMC 1079.18]MEC4867224.1 DUF4385 domain-containing protein [Jaaginema sp. PMC 1078.18]